MRVSGADVVPTECHSAYRVFNHLQKAGRIGHATKHFVFCTEHLQAGSAQPTRLFGIVDNRSNGPVDQLLELIVRWQLNPRATISYHRAG
jgi:hypothetical protein